MAITMGASAPSGLCCKEGVVHHRFTMGASPLRGDRAIRSNKKRFSPGGKKNPGSQKRPGVFGPFFVPLLSLARFPGSGLFSLLENPSGFPPCNSVANRKRCPSKTSRVLEQAQKSGVLT
jgi:hypothetical protein